MLNSVVIAHETRYYQTNMNGLVFHADSTESNESTNSLNYNKNEEFLSID